MWLVFHFYNWLNVFCLLGCCLNLVIHEICIKIMSDNVMKSRINFFQTWKNKILKYITVSKVFIFSTWVSHVFFPGLKLRKHKCLNCRSKSGNSSDIYLCARCLEAGGRLRAVCVMEPLLILWRYPWMTNMTTA